MQRQPVWVLGGGGVTGIAWEVGILAGLADEGVQIGPDAVLIGTSAGAVVGAQVTSGTPIDNLYERQRAGVPHETGRTLRLSDLLRLARAQLFARGSEAVARRLGRLALAKPVDDPERQRRIAEARLPCHSWGEADLRIVAVDAESGAVRVFTRHDGIALVDAVGASCAMPLSAAPVFIDDRRYIDGGMRSTLNLDLAPGAVRWWRWPRARPPSDHGPASAGSVRPSTRSGRSRSCYATRPPSGPEAPTSWTPPWCPPSWPRHASKVGARHRACTPSSPPPAAE
jgi:predicted acylesterase/phospholipase RssA